MSDSLEVERSLTGAGLETGLRVGGGERQNLRSLKTTLTSICLNQVKLSLWLCGKNLQKWLGL